MTKSSSKYLIIVMTAALAAVMYCFWAFPYRAALAYREEIQLFQTTGAYFHERVSSPLGLLTYISEFLTQFFNNYWIGAAVMTALFMAILLLSYAILRALLPGMSKLLAFAISLIPFVAIWLYMGDPNADLSLMIGILVILSLLMAGTLFIASSASLHGNGGFSRQKVSGHSAKAECSIPRHSPALILLILELVVAIFLYPKCYDKSTYTLINYDYMVRANDWDGILRLSDKNMPDLPLSVSATNLALAMNGQLDSRAFDYFQNGPEGLVPPFMKETLSSWTTGEIFFQLGMINSAQRFYFEGMEAIPTYNKSARAIKRLAETAIIRGDYKVARKYLDILSHTLFYKKWAKRTLKLIDNPDAVLQHPLYGKLRSYMIDEDYMFSEGELDKTFGQLFLKNPSNNLAKQYLIVYPLLERDLNKFAQYMGVVTERYRQYNPLLAQQAVAFMSMKNGQPMPQGMVSPVVEQSLRSFAQAWTSKNPDLIATHRHSLFHYLLSP